MSVDANMDELDARLAAAPSRLLVAWLVAVIVGVGPACGAKTGLGWGDGGDGGTPEASPDGGAVDADPSDEPPSPEGLCRPGNPPVALATGLERPYGLALDDSFVYVTLAEDNGGIVRVPKAGGAPVVLAEGQGRPRCLVLDEENVYFTAPIYGQVAQVPKTGGDVETLATFQHFPEGIALRGNRLYWLSDSTPTGWLMGLRLNRDDPPEEVLSGLNDPWQMRRSGSELVFNVRGDDPAIMSYSIARDETERLTSTGLGANDLALADGLVCFTTNVAAQCLDRSTGAVEVLAEGTFVDGIAVSGRYVFWTERGSGVAGGVVRRYDRQTSDLIDVATGQATPRRIEVDGGCVYWTNQGPVDGPGQLMRAPR